MAYLDNYSSLKAFDCMRENDINVTVFIGSVRVDLKKVNNLQSALILKVTSRAIL